MFAPVSVSPPKLQPVLSSVDSSPQPEKISLDDLTGILSGILNYYLWVFSFFFNPLQRSCDVQPSFRSSTVDWKRCLIVSLILT